MTDTWFIKIHRQIKDNVLFQEKRVFSKFEAWMDILMSCNFKEGEFLLWYDVIKIQPWEYLTSKVKLRQKYWWGEQKLNNFFKLLTSSWQASIKTVWKSRDKASLISVINWGKYQTDQGTKQDYNQGTTGVTNEGRPSTIEECKERKEKKEIYIWELEDLLKTWNELFETQHRVTPDMKRMYTTQRKTYSYEDIIQWCEAYYEKNKNNVKDVEWKNKYYLTLLKFITQKKNGFVSYL